jgi:hypothetical protein
MNKLLATLLILCAGPVWAEWVLYGASQVDGLRIYFDPSTVKGRDIKRVWTRVESGTKMPSGWRSARALEEVDCLNDRTRVIQLETFSQPNLKQIMETASGPSDWNYIAPGTVNKDLFNKVRGKK